MGQKAVLGSLVVFALVALVSTFSKDYVSEVRQNFHERSNSDLVNQMAAFQRASLVYMAYASYFGRSSVNLPGFMKFFLASSEAARKDSQRVLEYINMRGGHQQFPVIDMKAACKMMMVPPNLRPRFPQHTPQICQFIMQDKKKSKPKKPYSFSSASNPGQSSTEDWKSGLMALSDALFMERSLQDNLLGVIRGATMLHDKHLRHTIEDAFLDKKMSRIKKLGDVITRLRLYTEEDYPLGEYVIDLEMNS